MATIQSINIAVPGNVLVSGDKKIFSGILKKPVQGKIFLDNLGFQGDGVADHRFHGGGDKAVCVYCIDHYPFWEKELKQALSFGAFGENLSVTGLTETEVHIGDVFRVGEAEVQCTQPRQPCHKLNKVFDFQGMACRVQTTGFSGYYLRVLKPGWVEAGEKIVPLQADPKGISVETANDLMHKNKKDWDGIGEILSVAALSDSWRETFQKRLNDGTTEDTQLRLKGV
ncbi:MAG: MOSC domain-containing protein [Nitrospinae bacterium]|jgi:MOSC domain-containing protein YiiM|nr:MOSC domain-containing protein [Nitrospinota bacterium]MDA1108253.1 MOSC domain-containing protein [Nitrospinota bacterium]